jgi:hypothetical protein
MVFCLILADFSASAACACAEVLSGFRFVTQRPDQRRDFPQQSWAILFEQFVRDDHHQTLPLVRFAQGSRLALRRCSLLQRWQVDAQTQKSPGDAGQFGG